MFRRYGRAGLVLFLALLLLRAAALYSRTHQTSGPDVGVIRPPTPAVLSGLTGNPMRFATLNGIAVDAQANVYVAEDDVAYRIIKLSSTGRILANGGRRGQKRGRFDGPEGIAIGPNGGLYVADISSDRIEVLSPRGKVLRSWGRKGTQPGQFDEPTAVAVDAQGTVFTAERNGHRIQEFSSTGKPLLHWGQDEDGKDPGPGLFGDLKAITIDSHGDIYIADEGASLVKEYSATGAFIAQWGSYPDDPGGGYVDMTCTSGVVVDAQGNIYAVDSANNRILKLSRSGKILMSWHILDAASPGGIAIDTHGHVYVTCSTGNDTAGYRGVVYKLSPTGKTLAVWG